MKRRKICIVTGTRAEYGLLYWIMKGIKNDPDLDLQIIVTGMHLSPEFGLTFQEIINDGFFINNKVEMLLSGDTPSAISKSTGLGMIGLADAFEELKPDIVTLLGDRYELLAAASTALFANIPIAHISGGETTTGAFDEAIRHSITKMGWWHFVAAKEYKKRVIQLGEDPNRVHHVGSISIDNIKKTKLLNKTKLEKLLGLKFKKKNLIITYHPVTLEKESSKNNLQSLLNVLDKLNDTYIIFTEPNADTDNRIIKRMIKKFVLSHKNNSISFASMGRLNYLSALQFVDGVIGNSSSGLTEAPTFKIGTINIGDRQNGRLKADSIIDCAYEEESIFDAVKTLYSSQFQNNLKKINNPYGVDNTTEKIISVLKDSKIPKNLKKKFYNL
tara:strand:- start:426 stop:1586 length:1161 start_codon:yes stop_codon:yes gene_type:complete